MSKTILSAKKIARQSSWLALFVSIYGGIAFAGPSSETVTVYGRAEKRIGAAQSASEGSVSGDELRLRPILRPGEILEAVPGLIATQHSGGGKANQYFIRGFNLDHGTDFAATIDDFPINFLTHGHGQGYLDVNGLIPEVISRVEFRKGPYRADAGDFSFTGRANISTLDKLSPFLTYEIGEYDYKRFAIGGSKKIGAGEFLALGQFKHQDGPWKVKESFDGVSGLLKYSIPLKNKKLKIALHTYDATWIPTDQIPSRAVGTVLENQFASLDNKLRGKTQRQVLTMGLYNSDWRVTAWAQHYDWDLYSNFTFFLDDPVNGDQIRQYETMWAFGGRADRDYQINDQVKLKIGLEARNDDISEIGLDHAISGMPDYIVSRFAAREKSIGIYGELNYEFNEKLSGLFGIRQDFYDFETSDRGGGAWTNSRRAKINSPKLGLNYKILPNLALYMNWGEGFHSNDARGVTNPISPAAPLVRGHGQEIGMRFERRNLILSLDIWQSKIASELLYVADAGMVEPSDGGKRDGLEFTLFYRPKPWLVIDGTYSTNNGRYYALPKGNNFIVGAIKDSGEFGASIVKDHWSFGGRLRYLGERNLIEDNSVTAKPSTLVNLKYSYSPHKKYEYFIELLNALNGDGHDIDYYYTTRMFDEPSDGVDDIVFHPAEPRQLRMGLKLHF